jgi:hypothetical protein
MGQRHLLPHEPPPVRSPYPRPHRDHPRHPRLGPRSASAGFALIEVALALLVIAVATLGSVSWTLSGMSLEASNREMADGHDAMRVLLEELQEVPFDEVFARFNDLPGDDPAGAGSARGSTFSIEATRKANFLDRTPDSPSKGTIAYRKVPLEVQISFPIDEDGNLSEAAQGAEWGDRTWDFDGDGKITADALNTRYMLLPVRVRIRWSGAKGTRTLEHVRLLTHRTRPGDKK